MFPTILKTVFLSTFGATIAASTISAHADINVCVGICKHQHSVATHQGSGLRYSRSYEEQHQLGEPVYQIQPEEEYRSERRYRSKRRYRTKRHREPVYNDGWNGEIDYSNRTEFCSDRTVRRGDGWFKRKVKIRRCVWVRNDLLRDGGNAIRYHDDW